MAVYYKDEASTDTFIEAKKIDFSSPQKYEIGDKITIHGIGLHKVVMACPNCVDVIPCEAD